MKPFNNLQGDEEFF